MAPRLSNVAVLLALCLGCSATDIELTPGTTCTSQQVLPCIVPLIGFSQTPEGEEMDRHQTAGRPQDITEPQLKAACLAVRETVGCVAEVLQTCAGNISDVLTITRGTVKLMEVCDRPDLFTKAQLLINCHSVINASQSSTYDTCIDQAKASATRLQTGNSSAAAAAALNALNAESTGVFLRDACCTAKQAYDCIAPEFKKCTTETGNLGKAIYDAVIDAYGCQAKIAEGCPA